MKSPTRSNPILSILVCCLSDRGTRFLPTLLKTLERQCEGKDVEILFLGDNKYMTVGEKRNKLVEMSHGYYTVFVDDDDRIAGNYVASILSVLKHHRPDCVTFNAEITTNGQNPKAVMYSRKYKRNFDKGEIHYRIPNHLMPIKSKISKRIKFPLMNHGEDSQFAQRALPHIKTEIRIPGTLYYYDFNTEVSETYKQIHRRRRH